MEEIVITDEAKRFKAFRQAEKMTQLEIGELLGKTKSYVNKLEKGNLRISIEEVKILHVKKNMSYEWFYHGKGNRLHKSKDQNLIMLTTDLQNSIELLTQKIEQQDKDLKKIYRDFYSKYK